VIAAMTGLAVTASPAHAVPARFQIVNVGSGLCLEPVGTGNGALIQQQRCDAGRPGQVWSTVQATSTRSLVFNRFGPCMDVRDGKDVNRTPVQQWSCNQYARSMRWQITLSPALHYKFQSEVGNRCLDVAAGSNQPGAQLQIYSCSSADTNPAQLFELRPA
jgi:hypothetical protein